MYFDHTIEVISSIIFALAVLHTFATSIFQRLASRYKEGSLRENVFHLLGEVEVVFGFWAGILILLLVVLSNQTIAVSYVESLNFTEPLFVFAIMVVAATRPVIEVARNLILFIARSLPFPRELAVYGTSLVVGPLIGSLITEPAAMTVTALLLRDLYFSKINDSKFQYTTLAVLFVNVSIGGVLTNFAAPPVLMVASKWGWSTSFLFTNFGWKAIVAVLINAILATLVTRKILRRQSSKKIALSSSAPWPLAVVHLLFLGCIVSMAHHPVIFLGFLLFFLGLASITKEYQDDIQMRQALLVAFFLGGLVILGGLQSWWIDPLLKRFSAVSLFLGTAGLTAITDNAALTYLGSQVENSSEIFKYALVSGAVAGGGLTVIANAPNPAGFSILQGQFGPAGIQPQRLFAFAIIPTVVSLAIFWFL